MALAISDTGEVMLGDLSPELADDPTTQNILSALGREFERLVATALALFNGFFPQNVDTTYNQLEMWEMLLGISPNPALTVVERRAIVQGYVQQRSVGSGASWVALISVALGTPNWTHQEGPGAYQLSITLPSRTGSPSASAISALAKRVTPAHLQLIVGFDGGFLVGVSELGVEPL